jgi:hypothetical protein
MKINVNPTLKQPTVSPNAPAEITRARLRTRPMMIAPKIHITRHPTTRPPERVRAVLVEFLQIPFELGLESVLEVIAVLKARRAESDLILLAHPSDQL